ncbi:MAG: hypothetical protein IK013_03990 [Bacteroidales bacterium]|nr:hypothetical protein [Bacteroidales bacterium]
MKKIFILLLVFFATIAFERIYAQKDSYGKYLDSLCQSGLFDEAYQYAKQRWQSLPADKSKAYRDATFAYYRTTEMLEMAYRYKENFGEALKLNEELLALVKPETDYFAIRNKVVCYSGLGNYAEAAKNRALLYKAYKKHNLPCEFELCHYYNFDYFKMDTLNIWGYEWYDELPKNRFSTSFTKVVYYVYSTNPDGSDKDQLYRLHLIMFHGTDMPFDYIMEKHVSTEKGELRQSMYKYTYKENIDYEKLHNDIKEIVKGDKKTDTQQSVRHKAIEVFNPDAVNVSIENIEAREKTEYVSTEPYQEFQLFYGDHKHLNISLNGTVKFVTQTEVQKYGNSSKDLRAKQQTWGFLPNGKLVLCYINELFLKDSLVYDLNNARPLSKEDYDSTAWVAYYKFDASGLLGQEGVVSVGRDIHFEYDKNKLLTRMSTYYRNSDVMSEKVITLNDEGKPVRVEVFNYKDELKSRKCPSDLGPSGVKSVGIIDSYCYDDRGNMVAHQMHNGKIQWMDYFVYDSLNNMIFQGRCDDYRGDNNCKCKGFRKNQGYEYDDRHNKIREYSIGDWKPSGSDSYYQYDSAGREIDYKHYDVRGTQRTFDRHIQTTYDSAGRIVRKEALLGSFLVNERIFNYMRDAVLEEWAYDGQGNLEKQAVYQTLLKPSKIVRYQYSYDQHGNWVKRVRYEGSNEDSMTVTEILERKIEYYE